MTPNSPLSAPASAPPATVWPAELGARFRGARAVVILPTLNEERGLARTLSELSRQRLHAPDRRVEILIVDGGSTDGTLGVAAARGIPAVRQTGRGKGAAVLEAIYWVQSQRIPYAVVLDADSTYPPDRVLDALDLLEQSADLVVGIRRPVPTVPLGPREMVHRLGNIGLSYAASVLSRRTILDICSGFWGVSTDLMVSLNLEQASFAIEAELVLKAIHRQLRVVQIPIDYRDRIGEAKLRAVRDGARILLTILRHGRSHADRATPELAVAPESGELLSIGLITGSRAAVLECASSDSAAASNLATVLRRNFPETVVQVESTEPSVVSGRNPLVAPHPTPMVVSLTSAGSKDAHARAVAVSIGSRRRQLMIELPSALLLDAPEVDESSATARSGGWVVPGRATTHARFPSLEVLTSRLSYDRIDQQRTLLWANGFHAIERERRDLVELTDPVGEA